MTTLGTRIGTLFVAGLSLTFCVPRAAAQFYPYPQIQTPANGYLTGGASVIQSQAQFMTSQQQARLMNQQVAQSKVDTKRKTFDEWLYERGKTPTLEDARLEDQQQQTMRALNNPPLTEILSGKSLNDLLVDVQRAMATGGRGPQIPLDEETLRQINLSTGQGDANIGVIKNTAQLSWPLGLATLDSASSLRSKIEDEMTKARSQAAAGSVDPKNLLQLKKDLSTLENTLRAHVADLDPMDYIDSKRYIHDLTNAAGALQSANASQYVSGKYSATGRTVEELIQNMTRQGLRFAPAMPGETGAYVALHSALAAYDMAAHPSAFRVTQNGGGQAPGN